MAQIVLGIGTSHSPLLALEAADWALRARDDLVNPELNLSDGSFISYAELLQRTGPKYVAESAQSNLAKQKRHAEYALDRLAGEIDTARPDLVIIIGDDHEEMFPRTAMPSVAMFTGESVAMHSWLDTFKDPPPWLNIAITGYAMDAPHCFPGAPQFAEELVPRLMDRGIDLAITSTVDDPAKAGLGHAFGFVIKRLFGGRSIPVLPLLVNTYYPPNVVRPDRCYEIGVRLREAIEACPGDQRIAIVASGGLSHFVTDAELDRAVLEALRVKDHATLKQLPMAALNSGSSEILCWVVAAGALDALPNSWSEYIPVYRTEAGTGIGLAFAVWRPE